MKDTAKIEIGKRLRRKREQAGYSREKLGELCSLSPRFIANVEFGDSTFSLDSLMAVCRVLSCSSDDLLFGEQTDCCGWENTAEKLRHLDIRYKPAVDKLLQGLLETIAAAEQQP